MDMPPTDLNKLSVFRSPAEIIFGPGSSLEVVNRIQQYKATHILVVADANVLKAGCIDIILKQLTEANITYSTYGEIWAEPTLESLEQPAQIMKNSLASLVLAIGGGSAIDTAKGVSIIARLGGIARDYLGIEKVPKPGYPVIAMPTTAGTGSEVSPGCVLFDQDQNVKVNILSRYSIPAVAIIDPLLTITAPPQVTASAGMDALAHSLEAFTSTKATPLTDLFALEAIRLIAGSLRGATLNRSRLDDFVFMARGSLYAGLAMSNAGGAGVHALAYPLSAHYHVSHGISIGSLLPSVIEFNTPGNLSKYAQVARAMGEAYDGLSETELAWKASQSILLLAKDIGISSQLREFGVEEKDINLMAQEAIAINRLMVNNPRKITANDAHAIYQKCL